MTATTETPQATAPEGSTLFTLPAADVYNALANAIHFASKDDTLPAINAVNIAYDPATRTLIARATDRYQIIYVKIAEDIDDGYPEFDATISVNDVKTIISKLKGYKKFYDPMMQIDFHDDRAEFIYYADGLEKTEAVRLVDAHYPAVGSLYDGIYEGKDQHRDFAPEHTTFDAMQMYNTDLLTNIAKLRDYRETPRYREKGLTIGVTSKGGKLAFWFNDWAHGFIMPITYSDQRPRPADTKPAWITK